MDVSKTTNVLLREGLEVAKEGNTKLVVMNEKLGELTQVNHHFFLGC